MDDLAAKLEQVLTSDGVLPSSHVAEILEQEHLEIGDLLLRLLPAAARRASAPVSGKLVGAVAYTTSSAGEVGSLYLGANLEFPGMPLSATVHAEQAAVNNAWLHGESGVEIIAVTDAPCGHCRQFLNELTTAEQLQVIVASGSGYRDRLPEIHALSTLLPHPFGPEDLGVSRRLMDPVPEHPPLDVPGSLEGFAVRSALSCHAPYTRALAGVALQVADRIICGRLAENAAFNPTLSPMAGALSALAFQTNAGFDAISSAVLAETNSPGRYRLMAEEMLHSVAPQATLVSADLSLSAE